MDELMREQAIYLFALGLLTGIGPQNVLAIARAFPQLQTIPQLSPAELKEHLGHTLAQKLRKGLTEQWKSVFPTAERAIDQHLAKNILPLPLTSDEYPVLLKQIEDPPTILYIKGDLSVLKSTSTVAVMGTREPTTHGVRTAQEIAALYAQRGYVIVSGLARGIDTAAHQSTIAAHGKTIAVLPTPLDKVYPSENGKLAEEIAEKAGTQVSELPLGTVSSEEAFVQRDRLQSGLSLAVIPVQTTFDGGTMYTIRFALAHQRLLFCPEPAKEEERDPQYEGIWWLIKQKKADCFRLDQPETYEPLFAKLDGIRRALL
jgi:DNA processing protein